MTNPTPEQLEAAIAAYRNPGRMMPNTSEASQLVRMEAALEAAAGVTPQEPVGTDQRGLIHGAIWGHRMIDPGGVACSNDAHALADKVTSALAAPVQVDEAKLAEIVEDSRDRSRKERDIAKESLGQFTARLLVERRDEWLRGGGR